MFVTDATDVLESPEDQHPAEEEFLTAAMNWHFSPETGSKFWLDRLDSLDFDPRRDVRTHGDLRLFPNLVDELRDVRAADLIPRGYGGNADIIGAYESGGTTGRPKRVLLHADWFRRSLNWTSARMDALGFPAAGNWLALTPTGPHVVGRIVAELARIRRGIFFGIDLDPRWVRRCLGEGRHEEAERYTEHLLDQAALVLRQQPIEVLVVTPPLLERIAMRDELVELIGRNVRAILWGGAHLDPDTRHLLRTELFPSTGIYGMYGNTMILGGGMERPVAGNESLCVSDAMSPYTTFSVVDPGTLADLAEGECGQVVMHHVSQSLLLPDNLERDCVFDAMSPYTTFSVVDPGTLADVAEGERGQVVMHHVSKSLLLPNNLERDLATRVAAPPGALGVSVADVAPVPNFQDTAVIEGVY